MSPTSRRRVAAMARRNLLVQSRNPGHWFLLLVLPLVDALLFGSIGVAFGEGDGPVELLVTGIILFHLIWQLTLAGSLGLLEEVWSRNLMNLIATPLTEREFMGALGVVGLLRTAVSISVIAVVGVGF
jgi:ABC-2 type transport system permease protein